MSSPPPWSPMSGPPGQQSTPYGAPYSFPPHAMPSPPPPPKKKMSVSAWVALGGVGFLVVSMVGLVGYALVRASTPEGRAELSAQREKNRATVERAVATLSRASESLPTFDQGIKQCPAGTNTFLAPVVDSLYLKRVNGDEAAAADVLKTSKAIAPLRDMIFDEKLVEAAPAARAGKANHGLALRTAERIGEKTPLIVLAVDEIIPPTTQGSDFTTGELRGQVVVFDRRAGRILCHAPIEATSSETVKTGGGVRFRVKGIPTPAVGGSGNLAEAVQKDFHSNIKDEMKRSIRSMGAE